jgi:hypothetical protein
LRVTPNHQVMSAATGNVQRFLAGLCLRQQCPRRLTASWYQVTVVT